MVDIKDVLSFNYYTYKKPFTGSDNGKRYRLVRFEKEIQGEEGSEPAKELVFQAALWKDFLSFENTSNEKIRFKEFEFSPRGLEKVVEWINDTVVE